MGFRSGKTLLGLLGRIGNDNAKDEFYLTDAVALARGDRLEARMVRCQGRGSARRQFPRRARRSRRP